jgi:hypothetical protein
LAEPRTLIDIYGDESCHLERDGVDLMVLGAMSVPHARTREVADAIRALKEAHGLPRSFEIKWTKVSPAKVDFYVALVDLFGADPDLLFRGYVAHGKSQLRHGDFAQDHDTWYHKMYYGMLLPLIQRRDASFRIHIDIKDTRGGTKARVLHDVISTKLWDHQHEVVERIQIVQSHEVEILQLADLLIGAVAYRNRGLRSNTGKNAVVARLERVAHSRLDYSTPLGTEKVNLFQWQPRPAS